MLTIKITIMPLLITNPAFYSKKLNYEIGTAYNGNKGMLYAETGQDEKSNESN
jgi:hypothetical protein